MQEELWNNQEIVLALFCALDGPDLWRCSAVNRCWKKVRCDRFRRFVTVVWVMGWSASLIECGGIWSLNTPRTRMYRTGDEITNSFASKRLPTRRWKRWWQCRYVMLDCILSMTQEAPRLTQITLSDSPMLVLSMHVWGWSHLWSVGADTCMKRGYFKTPWMIENVQDVKTIALDWASLRTNRAKLPSWKMAWNCIQVIKWP